MSLAVAEAPTRAARSRTPDPAQLFERFRATDDLEVRNQLVRRYLPLASRLASRYARSPDGADELRQVAYLGLIKAVDRYDPARGASFVSFATPTILGELKRHLRDTRWAVHVPRDLQELAQRVVRQTDQLTPELGRAPTIREVADAMGLDPEEVVEARGALTGMDASSLDLPASADGESDETTGDRVGTVDDGYELVEDRETVACALARLPERQRRALRLRFADDMTQAEIGAVLGVSQMHVSRLLRRSLDQLRSIAGQAA
jgi:RNA polymerase sigma-B factor